jgi:beta-N-acetylhexosaminidase
LTQDRGAPPKAAIFGVSGVNLTDGEKQFFRYANPFGFILFQYNCVTPQQTKDLVKELRAAIGREDAPILIDQEGGRVARLKAPNWPEFPPARMFGLMAEKQADLGLEAAKINAQLIGHELSELGITVNCAPLGDVLRPETDKVIGDRAFSADPRIVADCARAYADGLLEAGVLPVIKHLPGHGRSTVDPHKFQTIVNATKEELEKLDFLPFRALRDLPIGMSCHIIFSNIDPKWPVSLSPIMHEIIRKEIGFDGLLMSDDLAMKGVIGRMEDVAPQVIRAGSDIALHCNGDLSEMVKIAATIPPMSDKAMERWEKAKARQQVAPLYTDKIGLMDRLDMLLGVAALTS